VLADWRFSASRALRPTNNNSAGNIRQDHLLTFLLDISLSQAVDESGALERLPYDLDTIAPLNRQRNRFTNFSTVTHPSYREPRGPTPHSQCIHHIKGFKNGQSSFLDYSAGKVIDVMAFRTSGKATAVATLRVLRTGGDRRIFRIGIQTLSRHR